MDPVSTFALGIALHLVSTEDGGRHMPLVGGSATNRFTYRPNWGLPGWADGEQSAAPVLGFSRVNIQPGEDVRAIIVPLFPDNVPAWREVSPGDSLRMYEGSRVCGRAVVLWVAPATWYMSEEEQDRLAQWLSEPDN